MKVKSWQRNSRMHAFLGVLIIFAILGSIQGALSVRALGTFPEAGAYMTYSGEMMGEEVTAKFMYNPWNTTFLNLRWIAYNETVFLWNGSYIEEIATRKIVHSSIQFAIPVGSHFLRALPAEMTAGYGSIIPMMVNGFGDADHIIVGEGTLSVQGVSLDYWIANGSKSSWGQMIWLEKTTGAPLRVYIYSTSVIVTDMTITEASFITPAGGDPISAYSWSTILLVLSVFIAIYSVKISKKQGIRL